MKNTVLELEKKILNLRNKDGIWDGHLSSSALAVAVAVFALWKYNPSKNKDYIIRGISWLKEHINNDGGFGDTTKSQSNLSTSLLCWSALSIVEDVPEFQPAIEQLENWIKQKTSSLEPSVVSKAILTHYSDDKTFSVPILAFCALSGRLGKNGWNMVPQLPFQLAVLPDRFFRWFNLSVVSYAIPALISMGLLRQQMKPTKNPLLRLINRKVTPKVLKVLETKQPENGGFLEATPLTGFVLMSMVGAGFKDHPVCAKAENFLRNSVREDGSWPIDTNLSTWVTTLSINALSNETFEKLSAEEKSSMLTQLLNQQFKTVHPFTRAKPGGWGWTGLPGSIPDVDDTSGALLALKRLTGNSQIAVKSATAGLKWLLDIQNNDGGFPTFCRGWGKLPFDASCPDITAHAIRAMVCWKDEMEKNFAEKLNSSLKKAFRFLKSTQRSDGSWLPLWFGNENDERHQNPVYGTSLVITGLCAASKNGIAGLEKIIIKGIGFLLTTQNSDGGWGGNKGLASGIEETALAIKALSEHGLKEELNPAVRWLTNKINNNQLEATPIGLYFASLWYFEKMYPMVFACGALNKIL